MITKLFPIMQNIGYNIRKIREAKNFTQESIANELGISRLAYCNIEGGHTSPNTKRLKQIADILKVKPQDFYIDYDVSMLHTPVSQTVARSTFPLTADLNIEALKEIIIALKEIVVVLKAAQKTAE